MVETTGGEPDDGTAEVLDRPMADGVRRRVVQIVSDGFGGLTVAELPAQLRQYARFTPNRRAKFAGNAMAAGLLTETVFGSDTSKYQAKVWLFEDNVGTTDRYFSGVHLGCTRKKSGLRRL